MNNNEVPKMLLEEKYSDIEKWKDLAFVGLYNNRCNESVGDKKLEGSSTNLRRMGAPTEGALDSL